MIEKLTANYCFLNATGITTFKKPSPIPIESAMILECASSNIFNKASDKNTPEKVDIEDNKIYCSDPVG